MLGGGRREPAAEQEPLPNRGLPTTQQFSLLIGLSSHQWEASWSQAHKLGGPERKAVALGSTAMTQR